MIKTLLKKQFLETTIFLRRDKQNTYTLIGYSLFSLMIIALCCALVILLSLKLCGPLTERGYGWLYFSLIGIIATAVGVFSSIFMTHSTLYEAKDNELLLSMPIRPGHIFLTRMFSIYLVTLALESLVMIPALIIYALTVPVTMNFFPSSIMILLVFPLLALTISCLFSWLIALFSVKIRNIGTSFVFALLFAAFFCYCFVHLEFLLATLLQNTTSIRGGLQIILYPIYHMGHSAEGSFSSLLIFSGFVLGALLLVYLLVSRSFLSLSTGKRTVRHAAYNRESLKAGSLPQSLLWKELQVFSNSSTYLLNCSLGSILLLLAIPLVLLYRNDIRLLLEPLAHGHHDPSPLIGAAVVALLASLNVITAPSINLESKTLWLIQTLPVSGWHILRSKLQLHWIITAVPAILCSLAVSIAIHAGFLFTVLSAIFVGVYIMMTGVLGLMLNLLLPNFRWATESAAVKHSISVILSLVFNWLILALCVGMYYLMASNTHFEEILLFWAIGVWFVAHQITHWLKTDGARILKTM